jgi:hypothetical protein
MKVAATIFILRFSNRIKEESKCIRKFRKYKNVSFAFRIQSYVFVILKGKVIPLHAMEALGVRGDIAPTHS